MEIQMGKGEWLFCRVTERGTNRHGIHIRKANEPKPIGQIDAPYDPMNGIPENDVVIWLHDLESVLVISDVLNSCALRLAGWERAKGPEECNPPSERG